MVMAGTTTIDKATAVQEALTSAMKAANDLDAMMKRFEAKVDELIGDAVEETGDIKQAAKWLDEGKKVRRKAWGATFYCYKDNIYSGCLLLGAKYCEERYWSPSVCDLLADDWVVVK